MSTSLDNYLEIRKFSEHICSPLQKEDYVVQPVVYVSPPKWHLAHTTWFFEEFILKKFVKNYKVYNDQYNYLFNSYYESNGEKIARPLRGNLTRPTVEEIYAYRSYVDNVFRESFSLFNDEILNLVTIGINHEQQHQELLITDIKYIFGHNPLFPKYADHIIKENKKQKQLNWLSFKKGIYHIGNDGKHFCYDNELPKHSVFIHNFSILNRLVTNEEFINFINNGGYQDFKYWHDEGWSWVQNNQINAPEYWILKDDDWYVYTLNGLEKINLLFPVTHISYYEAYAFAQWSGFRLPTEEEWEIASKDMEWGQRWEWTESAYSPYPGYKKPEGALGEYNGKFMVNQKVLKGASVATSSGHSRNTYRNFFHPNERWQYTGIRLAK